MKDYKRFTEAPSKDRCYYNQMDFIDVDEMYDRLAELEDLIEQGRLIELPCKVGDTIYRILPRCDNINKCSEFDQHICSRSNCDWHIRETKFALNMFNYIGDYYFTTKEEAEAKLQELKGEQK